LVCVALGKIAEKFDSSPDCYMLSFCLQTVIGLISGSQGEALLLPAKLCNGWAICPLRRAHH